MIDTLRKLFESLDGLPLSLQEEAVQQMEPLVDCLVDRHCDELFAGTPERV